MDLLHKLLQVLLGTVLGLNNVAVTVEVLPLPALHAHVPELYLDRLPNHQAVVDQRNHSHM